MAEAQVALVTGASRGIGRAIAIALARSGARVVVNYKGSVDAAGDVVRVITEAGGSASAIQADVSNKAGVDALISQTQETFGAVTILVNNAGIRHDNLFLRMD